MIAFESAFGRKRGGSKPRVVELFAGAGFFSYAFQEQGFKLDQAYEKDKSAAATYAKNLGNHIKVCDLTTYRPEGRAEVLIAGPPCQGFSSLGQRNPDDPRNDLGLIIPKWAAALKTPVVVIENVAGYLKSPTWEKIRLRFEKDGFETFTWVLNAADFGAPQRRVRSFTIFSKIGEPKIVSKKSRKAKTVRQAFANLPAFPSKASSHFTLPRTELALKRIRLVPPGGDIRDIARIAPRLVPPSWYETKGKIVDIWGRMRWDSIGPTIRTGFLNPSRGRFLHPDEDRPISFREAARLQTVPDSYQFIGFASDIASQIGNGIPINLGRAVATSVRELFE